MDYLKWLVDWFNSQCDGDYEHGNGITISTLDNPGWDVSIDLEGTELENINITPAKIERSEHDWIIIGKNENTFNISGGPGNLLEMLKIVNEIFSANKTLMQK